MKIRSGGGVLCRSGRRLLVAAAVALGCSAAWANESESAAFILDTSGVPVTLSVLEISSAAGVLPVPVAVCMAGASVERALVRRAGKER